MTTPTRASRLCYFHDRGCGHARPESGMQQLEQSVLGGAALQRCGTVTISEAALAAEVPMAALPRGNTLSG